MQINSETPQAALERLYRAVTRRELLKESPLNLRWALRFALLFLLFPGMVCGFWAGLGLTLVFCVGLLCLLGMNHTPEAVLAAQLWLGAGGCVFVGWCALSWRAGQRKRRLRETPRPAEPGPEPPTTPCAEPQALRWRKQVNADGTRLWVAQLKVCAAQPGIHAFFISARGMARQQFLTLGQQGVCTVHSAMSGDKLQALLLYKLTAGVHTLRWSIYPATGSPPTAEATLLSAPQGD